ncbi:ATPase RavA [Rosistilla carotiformis]|uniref:ATPase RavA n=2 Tax=Rosistilla carotiformis TaxID=2528017 RepID=A0A518JRP3_9BACT|nr:ATPase RavA [Rosistilla carotiformis]
MIDVAFSTAKRLQENMEKVVLGKPEVVRSLLIAVLAGEHVLLDDVPGVGKTLAAKALARSLDGVFTRVQFTPDLLPSDILGSNLYRSDLHEFEFNQGPVFANVVLADEINRAPPRTQSALLEAMSEGQVSIDGTTRALPKPFTVVATQNPIEFEGTYRLPESQLDRFLLRTSVGYPQPDVERDVLRSHCNGEPVDQLSPVVSCHEVLESQEAVRKVRFEDSLISYLLAVVDATRQSEDLQVGVSTRAALSYFRGCQARAVCMERDYVVPDDIKSLAVPVLSHRVVLKDSFMTGDRSRAEQVVHEIVQRVTVPV